MAEATVGASPRRGTGHALKRFFRTPKGMLLALFALLVPVAAIGSGIAVVLPGVIAACAAAMLLDAPLVRWRTGAWEFPDGALLTALIVAMVLSPHLPWHVAAVTSAIAIASKYALRGRSANVFNPAALALLVTYYVYDAGHSWWGALPELPILAISVLFATGVYISNRVGKLPAVVAFLGVHFLLFTGAAFLGDPARVAEMYREPDLHAALFFAFFMVTDPPTSPPKARDQVTFGIITAAVSFATFELLGAVYFLLAGLLAANAWEAWRRHAVASRRASARGASA